MEEPEPDRRTMINYYATLGVLPESSAEEIKASYRQLAKRYHPDMRGGNASTFARIRAAYDVLSEPGKRLEFDKQWQEDHERRRKAQQALREQQAAASQTAANAPIPMLTRVMSIAMPRSGRFQMDGIIGKIQVEPTRP